MMYDFEPYRIRVVEPIRGSTREQRGAWIWEAGYNPFLLRADQVLIDMVTDSGVSAPSLRQWAAMQGSDESFAGSRSYFRFMEVARQLFGHRHVIPCHQGRAAEQLLCRAVIEPGQVVLGNTIFSTTRANIEERGGAVEDLPVAASRDPADLSPFKGNIDVEALEGRLELLGSERSGFVVLTVTDNSGGGQPVSLENVRAARETCHRHGVRLLLDAARVAENCGLISEREPGQELRSPREIAQELFSLVDGVFMSLKKDGLGNTGGLITTNDKDWADRIREVLLRTEGIPTAGGLAGRDLEAMAVALDEMLDADHVRHRLQVVRGFGERLRDAGVPVLQPVGGHAVYVDGRAFCGHLPDDQLPAWSLSVALYVASGVRSWETGNVMRGARDPDTGVWSWPPLDLLRLAVPRRVYTDNHLAYVVRSLAELYIERHQIRGLRFVDRPEKLAQFVATFEPID